MLRVLKLYYNVASSQLAAHKLLRVLKLYYKVASSQLPAPQILRVLKVVLQSRQFSSSSSPDTPRTKVVLQSRHFSASSSTDTPRTKVVLQSRQFSASSSPHTPRTKVVLQSRQFSASSSPDAVPATKSAHGGSQSAVPATKSAHGGSQSAAPATKSAHGGSHLRARTIRRLATKACKTQCNYAPSDDTGTPSSQNYNGGTLRAQTMESHFPTSMKSAAHIRDILATRITMGERSGHRPGTDLGIAFPDEYAVRTAHWRHPCDQNSNGAPSRAQTKCTFHHTFARSTRTISAEGCSRTNAIRVSPHARAIDGHDSTRGLRFVRPARTAPPPKEKNKEEVG